jgi:hypothetical protein
MNFIIWILLLLSVFSPAGLRTRHSPRHEVQTNIGQDLATCAKRNLEACADIHETERRLMEMQQLTIQAQENLIQYLSNALQNTGTCNLQLNFSCSLLIF